jgi:hypothetical protein
MKRLCSFIESTLPGSKAVAPELPFHPFSFADLNDVACDVMRYIDTELVRGESDSMPFEDIILVGYSAGSLLARKIHVLAQGQTDWAPFEKVRSESDTRPRHWAGKIRRIVLLAGVNRGWRLTHHMKIPTLLKLGSGVFAGELIQFITRKKLMIFQTRRGAPFMTNLRLQWLAMEKKTPGGQPLVPVIQLLGSIDDIVSPDDNLDLVTGRNFIYMDVPFSGHKSILDLGDDPEGGTRKEMLLAALTEPEEVLRQKHVLPTDEPLKFQAVATGKNDKVKDVIFVIHGIRDKGYWTHKIARRVQRAGRPIPKIYSSETSTYGYFAMLPFILSWRRRDKMEWLMDQYVEAVALYPDARFSFVGHSNGTHLLAKALTVYKACRFDNIVFAGSVVRHDFDWASLQRNQQVVRVLNYVATRDLVVAVFPGAFEKFGSELGSAGHNGFCQFKKGESDIPGFHEVWGIKGGHGAALVEENWNDITDFIVQGNPPQTAGRSWIPGKRSWFAVAAGWLAPLLLVGLVAMLVAVGWGLWHWTDRLGSQPQILAMGAYVWAVLTILTKV